MSNEGIQLSVNILPSSVNGNFEQVESYLAEKLTEYNVTVTEENLPECKKMSTELSKLKESMETRRKELKAIILEPYTAIEDKIKSLVAMVDEVQNGIKTQVKSFENIKLESCRFLLTQELAVKYAEAGVEDDFKQASIDDIVKLSSMTGKGGLTKSAMDAVESLVIKDKSRQELHARRILSAENACLKAGIQPIAKIHLSKILDTKEESIFEYQLTAIIDAEKEHQSDIKASIKEEVKAEIKAEEKAIAKPVNTTGERRRYMVLVSFPISADNLDGIEDRIKAQFNLPNVASIKVREYDAGDEHE